MQTTLRKDILSMALERYGTQAEYLFAKYPSFAVLRHPNGKWYGVIMTLPVSKLGLSGEGTIDVINLKCDPLLCGSLRLQSGILPAYHMNKESWNTVLLDGTVDLEQLGLLLDISYDLVGKNNKGKKKSEEAI